jgi:hypothetical protein
MHHLISVVVAFPRSLHSLFCEQTLDDAIIASPTPDPVLFYSVQCPSSSSSSSSTAYLLSNPMLQFFFSIHQPINPQPNQHPTKSKNPQSPRLHRDPRPAPQDLRFPLAQL